MIFRSGIFIVIISVVFISSRKICYRINSGGYEAYCCNNYVRHKGQCIECEPGTKSKNEKPCTPCSIGTFGRKCSSFCDCSVHEKCDRVFGCLFDTELLSTESENTTADVYADTNTNYIQTVVDQNIFQTKEGISEREIYIYSAGFGGFFILIVSVLLIFKYYKRHKAKKLRINQIIEHNRIQTNEEIIDESLYESIDESTICDDNIQITNLKDRKEDDNTLQSGSDVSSKSSGYLHPYTSFSGKFQKHCSPIISPHSSSVSFQSGDNKRDSGYTHPYQQLQQENDDRRKTSKSDYTELTAVHYLELVDFPITKETVRQNSFLSYSKTSHKVCKSESHKYSDGTRSFSYPLGKLSYVQQLQSTSQMSCHYMTKDIRNQTVKRYSI